MITPRRITCSILSLVLVSSCVQTGPAGAQRIVRVKVLADASLREKNAPWAESARAMVEVASDYFESEFGIRFVTTSIQPWSVDEKSTSTAHLLTRLKETASLRDPDGAYDLVIGFTGASVDVYRGRARVDRIGNCRDGLGNYLVSYVSGPFRYRGAGAEPELDVVALIHELGHIFGAEHVQDTESIMHENFDYRTEFDRKNRAVILKNKFCPFRK